MSHGMPVKDVLKSLKSSLNGLSQEEAEKRLKEYGLNEIREAKKVSPFEIFLRQFRSIVIWILIAAVIISAFLEEYVDAIVILVILVLIAVLGFVQEYRAERAIEALKKLASLKATVLRDGQKKEIDSKEVVPGDIIFLETGDKIPADARLIESFNFQTQEAALTGESQPVKKSNEVLHEKTILAERKNMVYAGTIAVSGRTKAIVASTGMQTEIGKIAALIEEVKPELTPLQKKMDSLGKVLGYITIVIAIIVFSAGLIVHRIPWSDMLIVSVSLAVAAIPEGLPAVVTISLALGTQRMLKRNALIRRLPSVETLGSTTIICTDKTGTLTVNEMTVKKIFANDKIIDVSGSGYDAKGEFLHKGKPIELEEIELLLKIGALNNNAELSEGSVIGDPTEGCLIVSAEKAGLKKKGLESEYLRIDEIEFTSERKMMTTIHKHKTGKYAFVKGAPEVVLELCNFIHEGGKAKKLTGKKREEILSLNKKFADDALRVLGIAYKKIENSHPEKDLTFVGLVGMIDPPREEVKIAVEKCKKAGIGVVMITGDNETTAKAIAREIGFGTRAITGAELEKIKNLDRVVENIDIFARVNPEHKIRIVDALKKKGHVVAMTGDGVNDAPALKKADIGIAMGITGTDVSKEASSMILTDDNFASIVNAVEEGRGTYDNIRKYFAFLISGNIGEVFIIFLAIIFGLPLPLTATQILLINLVTDGLPAIALSADPFEPNAMSRKPRKQDEPIYRGLNAFIVFYPIAMVIVALSVFSWFYFQKGDLTQAQTATFLTISMFEFYQAFSCRSTIYPTAKVGFFKNRYLVIAAMSSFAIIAASIFFPPFGKYLDMVSLSIAEFITIVIISTTGAIVIEISKYLKKEPLNSDL
ncbi:MAG TPA: calcium-translocating P-type ATPase, SERCA-type [Candidatus Nanoarchaeia archaeon]|nr:calcium-translocating P-type ATPase, SERCA-type [Candidatus Nanoarchaeia archaeon]